MVKDETDRSSSSSAGKSFANTIKKNLLEHEDRVLAWEELCAVEKRRRALLKKTELPFLRILASWDGTVLQAFATDVLLWITMLIYVAIRIGARFGMPEFVNKLGGTEIGVIGGFLSFFLVLFAVDSNKRFGTLYMTSMQLEGRINDVALLTRCSLPRERALRLTRYMNAVHIAGYVGLSQTYSFKEFFLYLNARNQVLTEAEIERMTSIDMESGGACCKELLVWCCNEIADALKEGLIDPRLAFQLREQVIRLRGSFGDMYDILDQPISFHYIHFVCLLSAMYLPLFSITTGLEAGSGDDAHWLTDVVSGLLVFLQSVFVIGLRTLAVKMSDPYGSDVQDLSVMQYLNDAWISSTRMVHSDLPGPVNAAEEESLCAKKEAKLGDAFEPYPVADEFSVGDDPSHC